MIEFQGRRYFVVDAHTHIGNSQFLAHFGMPTEFREDAMVRDMDAAGVDVVAAFPTRALHNEYRELNDVLLHARERFPMRICSYVRLYPHDRAQALAELKRCVDRGARGVKFHGYVDGAFLVNDRSLMAPLFEVIAEAGLPVLFHSGEAWNCSPTLIADLARDFPTVPVVIGHMGGLEYHEDAFVVASRQENLYLDTCGLEPPGLVGAAVRRVGKERVVMGSDHPYVPFGFEIDKVTKYAGLTEDEMAHVLGLNMARLLKLDVPEG